MGFIQGISVNTDVRLFEKPTPLQILWDDLQFDECKSAEKRKNEPRWKNFHEGMAYDAKTYLEDIRAILAVNKEHPLKIKDELLAQLKEFREFQKYRRDTRRALEMMDNENIELSTRSTRLCTRRGN